MTKVLVEVDIREGLSIEIEIFRGGLSVTSIIGLLESAILLLKVPQGRPFVERV
jgi:hypothetical protein